MNRVIKLIFLLLINFEGYSQSSYISPASSNACYGNNSILLTLTNNTKPIKRWEMSVTGGDPWTTINCLTSTFTVTNLKASTWFRVIVQEVAQPEETSQVGVVNVYPEAKAGIISGATNVCKGANSGQLTLAGFTGVVTRWESSLEGTLWNPIAGSAGVTAYLYNNISIKTYFRAIVQSGAGCIEIPTAAFIINVDEASNPGSIAGANTVCKSLNSGSVVVSGLTGSVVRWESSSTGLSPWMSINETGNTLNYSNLVNSTWYRSVVKNGTCPESPSSSVTVTVNEPSLGGTSLGLASVCSKINNGDVTLTGYNGDIQQWQYSKNNGSTWIDTTVVQPSISYNNLRQSRIYRANIKNGVCAAAWSSQTKITVNPLPVLAFTAPAKPQGEAITFSNASTIASGSLKQYSWDFGDGSSSTSKNPIHTFINPGTYNVRLEVMSDKGCSDSLKQNLEVYEVPGANFTFSNVCLKAEAQFTNASAIAYPTPTFLWNFGDGSATSTDENPSHQYSLPGKYSVTFIVSTPYSSSTITKTIEIYNQAKPAFEVKSVCLGNSMEFINKSSIKEGYLTYGWLFGDTKTSNDVNPVHSYSAIGTFTVRLITTSNYSCLDTIYKKVYVNPVPQANFSVTNVPFGYPNSFTNSSTISSGTFTNSWIFGDGNSSALPNPLHTYSTAGNYLVSLSLQSDSGCVASQSKTVWVYPKPHAAFVAQPVCVYDSISFDNQSTISSGSLTYRWKFGDGGISIKKKPSWKYLNPGVYNVTLIATSDMTGVDSITKSVEIYPQPAPDFSAQNVCDGFPVLFTNASAVSTGSIVNYLWDLGDGSNAVRQSPTRQYLNPGNYRVSLTVTTDKSCKFSISHDVIVYENPVANFTISSVCFEQQVSPLNTSTAENDANSEWNMGDGQIMNAFSFSHYYQNPGLYKVKLKITDLRGCVDSLTRNVNIYPLPNVDAGADTTVVLGYSVQLFGKGASTFQWYPSDGLNSVFLQNPISKPTETITYFLTAQDQNGCVNQDSVRVSVVDKHIIIASNILTPDGNGENDTWFIQNIENYSTAELTIFNRWGTIVYHTKNYQNNWNGTNSNNDILPDGTYYYVITIPGSEFDYKGSVTILRNK